MLVKFHAVTNLPATLEANAFYFVQNGSYAESYVTSNSGLARGIGNTNMIKGLIAEALASFEGGGGGSVLLIEDTIATRDALDLVESSLVLVVDASADPTVNSGSALYAWNAPVQTWIKVAEYESMDVIVSWDSIQNGPTSTPNQIDSAVSAAHTHTNKPVLDGLSDDGGRLRYNGNKIEAEWETKNW